MIIFVTGYHRSGTRTHAKYLAHKYGLLYIDETVIRWDSFEAAQYLIKGYYPEWNNGEFAFTRNKKLDRGFILHCPGLAYKTIELAKYGIVYWCSREFEEIITSMHNNGFYKIIERLMNAFIAEFPDDKIWKSMSHKDTHNSFIFFLDYYILFVTVKQYFYKKYFKDMVKVIKLEDQKYFNLHKTSSYARPLRGCPEVILKAVAVIL